MYFFDQFFKYDNHLREKYKNKLVTKQVSTKVRKTILKLIRDCEFTKNFDTDLIHDISEFACSIEQIPFTAQNDPINTEPITFDILLYETIVKCISIPNKSDNFAKAVILHEIFHCKEINITSQIIGNNYYFMQTDSTYLFILRIGMQQWSEYYAHYNSSVYYKTNPKLEESAKDVDIYMSVFSQKMRDAKNIIQMPESFLHTIEYFICSTIIAVAQNNQLGNEKLIVNNSYLNDYILNVSIIMKQKYAEYPTWVSIQNFMDIGRKLMGFLHNYHIGYSTEDLSDNFMFKYIE